MHFGLLNSQQLNCFAMRQANQYYVGISGMIPIALLELSSYFFAQTDFYPEIGEVNEGPKVQLDGLEAPPFYQLSRNIFIPLIDESLPIEESTQLFRSIAMVRGHVRHYDHETGRRLTAQQYLQQFDTLIDMLLPVCLVRREHCRYLASIMVHFFWFHEMAHVTQGHLRFLQKETKQFRLRLCEFAEPTHTQHAAAFRPHSRVGSITMEHDADIEAIMMTIGIIMLDIDIETDDFPYVEKRKRLELFVFALISVFSVISLQDQLSGKPENLTHPSTRLRLVNILRYFLDLSTDKFGEADAVNNGIKKAKELSVYGKMKYFDHTLRFDDAEAELLLKQDSERENIPTSWDAYGYANLRIVVMNWLAENPTLSERIAETKVRASRIPWYRKFF